MSSNNGINTGVIGIPSATKGAGDVAGSLFALAKEIVDYLKVFLDKKGPSEPVTQVETKAAGWKESSNIQDSDIQKNMRDKYMRDYMNIPNIETC